MGEEHRRQFSILLLRSSSTSGHRVPIGSLVQVASSILPATPLDVSIQKLSLSLSLSLSCTLQTSKFDVRYARTVDTKGKEGN